MVKLAWPCLKEQSLHLPGWKLTAHGDIKPMPGLLWTLSVHPRLTITPLKPRQISSVFSIHPDAHLTTTTLDNWRWDGSYPGPMDNLMMATLMRWWPPWTHGQPDDGYPDEMLTYNLRCRATLALRTPETPGTLAREAKQITTPGTWTPWCGLDSRTIKKQENHSKPRLFFTPKCKGSY